MRQYSDHQPANIIKINDQNLYIFCIWIAETSFNKISKIQGIDLINEKALPFP
jgi:hypothetical protein